MTPREQREAVTATIGAWTPPVVELVAAKAGSG
jgi:hypothetical protein